LKAIHDPHVAVVVTIRTCDTRLTDESLVFRADAGLGRLDPSIQMRIRSSTGNGFYQWNQDTRLIHA